MFSVVLSSLLIAYECSIIAVSLTVAIGSSFMCSSVGSLVHDERIEISSIMLPSFSLFLSGNTYMVVL